MQVQRYIRLSKFKFVSARLRKHGSRHALGRAKNESSVTFLSNLNFASTVRAHSGVSFPTFLCVSETRKRKENNFIFWCKIYIHIGSQSRTVRKNPPQQINVPSRSAALKRHKEYIQKISKHNLHCFNTPAECVVASTLCLSVLSARSLLSFLHTKKPHRPQCHCH